jgi:hypothetical protein
VSAYDSGGKDLHLVLLLDTLGLALGGRAAGRASVGGSRATNGVGVDVVGGRSGGSRDVGTDRGNHAFDVEPLEPVRGDFGVLLHQLALDALLNVGLLLDLVNRVAEDHGLAATLASHAGSHGSKAIEALANGQATLLLGEDVVLLLLGVGEARAVVVVRAGAVAAGRRVAGVGVGRHGLRRGGWLVKMWLLLSLLLSS